MYTLDQLQKIIEAEFKKRFSGNVKAPETLYLPVEYALDEGGKRVRPLLVLLAYNMFSNDVYEALPAAVAIEVFHNFTLLHDDIMDNADVRRNRPTVHRKFGENSAILSGDVMSFLSYRFLYECKSDHLAEAAKLITQTAIEVCEGQQYDMDFETRDDVSEEEYLEMIRLKTAVLLACSLKTGALLAGAENRTADYLYLYGLNLGLAFQLQDDLLDTFGDQKTFGKKIGGDIMANKKTFLLINALKKSNSEIRNSLLKWYSLRDCNQHEKVKSVTKIFVETGAKKATEEKIGNYFSEMDRIYELISVQVGKKAGLKTLADKMLKRIS